MYLRWKRRELRRTWERNDGWAPHRLEAAVVSSRRIEGTPRQEVVAYLGSIREEDTGDVVARAAFWETAGPRIAGLGLPDDERARVEAAIEDRVPRPDDDERAAAAELRRFSDPDTYGKPTPLGPLATTLLAEKGARRAAEAEHGATYDVKRNGRPYRMCVVGQRMRRTPKGDAA